MGMHCRLFDSKNKKKYYFLNYINKIMGKGLCFSALESHFTGHLGFQLGSLQRSNGMFSERQDELDDSRRYHVCMYVCIIEHLCSRRPYSLDCHEGAMEMYHCALENITVFSCAQN